MWKWNRLLWNGSRISLHGITDTARRKQSMEDGSGGIVLGRIVKAIVEDTGL